MILFIDKNKILSKSQFEFQANRCTSLVLIHLTDLIASYLDKSEKVAGVFLDILKTFDSINHNILLQRLFTYGFRRPIYSWLKFFITNQFQRVD